MSEETAWEKAAAAEGVTESERALTRVAKKAFLSLWSYANVFTDEGRSHGKGDGKELCDLLVVFGNSVLLFSDKSCEYKTGTDVKVAWPRWYKRAIEKSVRQLAGAEKFLRSFPHRVFIDRQCQTPLPVELPSADVVRYFRIAVTRGAHQAARSFFGGGSSGSVMLNNDVRGAAHYDNPFEIGYPLESGCFVHVLDEMTVDLLLEELDTVPDIVSYLSCKEAFFSTPGVEISVAGEEDLLARYMLTLRDSQHGLPEIPNGVTFFALAEGEWADYVASPQRAAKREADKISYLWDSLVELQSGFIRAGTALGASDATGHVNHERVVRAMAEQNRLVRRQCGADLHHVLNLKSESGLAARVQMDGTPPTRAFVFLAAKRRPELSYEDFRAKRAHILTTYCTAIKGHEPSLQEAIGVAGAPFSEGEPSFEFVYVDHSKKMSEEDLAHWLAESERLGILRPETRANQRSGSAKEFPEPFFFDKPEQVRPSNRAERRQAAREARRAHGKRQR